MTTGRKSCSTHDIRCCFPGLCPPMWLWMSPYCGCLCPPMWLSMSPYVAVYVPPMWLHVPLCGSYVPLCGSRIRKALCPPIAYSGRRAVLPGACPPGDCRSARNRRLRGGTSLAAAGVRLLARAGATVADQPFRRGQLGFRVVCRPAQNSIRHLLPRGEPLTMGKEEPTIRLGDLRMPGAVTRETPPTSVSWSGTTRASHGCVLTSPRPGLRITCGRWRSARSGGTSCPGSRVQLRHREGPGRRGEPVAQAGQSRQGSGNGVSGTAAAQSGSSHVRKPRGEPAMSEPLILRSDDGPVAVLTLNRPDSATPFPGP